MKLEETFRDVIYSRGEGVTRDFELSRWPCTTDLLCPKLFFNFTLRQLVLQPHPEPRDSEFAPR